jgi:hypothetical protein
VTALTFGGGRNESNQDAWSWEVLGESQWYANQRHRVKLMTQSRLDGFTSVAAPDQQGAFTFISLAQLRSGRPTSYTHIMNPSSRQGSVWNGAIAAADFWRPSAEFDVVYGLRLEANRFLHSASLNSGLAETLAVRNDFVPNRMRLLPRVGFIWRYSQRSAQVPLGPMSAFGLVSSRPSGVLRGGIGGFRSTFRPDLVADAIAMTGLEGTPRRLVCLGDAVPQPSWNTFAVNGAPSTCVGSSSLLVDTARAVTLIDAAYTTPSSLRANLVWTTYVPHVALSIDGVVSLNRNQTGTIDLNLRPVALEYLASEGGRALYARTTDVVPQTGAVPATTARRDARYGRVTALRSDLRSLSQQLVVTAEPSLSSSTQLSMAYVLGRSQSEQRGFDGAAFGTLIQRERARGDLDVRHQIVTNASHTANWLGGTIVTIAGVFRSGYPYTPMISGDVNGDGVPNDRAFVHAPSALRDAGDLAAAAAMESLLAGASGPVRRCLTEHMNQDGGRNSCEGPWTAIVSARVDLPWRFVSTGIGTQRRVRVALDLKNVLGGLDQLLHGSSSLRGWGSPALPQQTLYTVVGFDTLSQRFRYQVNPRFGRSDPASSVLRSPFRATVDISVDLGRPVAVQQIDRFLAVGRSRPGAKLDSTALRARYSRNLPNVYRLVVAHSDSLFLTRPQIDSLERGEAMYLARLDSVWGGMAGGFSRLPDQFDAQAVLARQEAFLNQAWEINRAGALQIKQLLRPEQLLLTSAMIRYLVSEKGTIRTRITY